MKCFANRWKDVISHFQKRKCHCNPFTEQSHGCGDNRHWKSSQLMLNFLTPKTFNHSPFSSLSEKPEKPHSAIVLNMTHPALPALRSVKCKILPVVVHFKLNMSVLSVFSPNACAELHYGQLFSKKNNTYTEDAVMEAVFDHSATGAQFVTHCVNPVAGVCD